MTEAFIGAAVRTPIGRYGGSLCSIRPDDLAVAALRALIERHPTMDLHALDDVVLGCANQAGEDNRNIARMALLLAGLPQEISGSTVNRLCGSGMDAVGIAARAIMSGESELVIAGGVESMSRAPFVMPKAETAFSRSTAVHDTTIGWRFINPVMQQMYGTDSMPETAENVAVAFGISRHDQDVFALRSQSKALAAQKSGRLAREIVPVTIHGKKGQATIVSVDEHPRESNLESLSKLKPIVRPDGTVTAGNASGVNDGACALILASEAGARRHGLTLLARVVGIASAGCEPRIMGMGPLPATRKLLARTGVRIEALDVIELNEAFASQSLAVLRELGIADDDARVNRNGGAIALGHPLGMSGARLVATAAIELAEAKLRYALTTMCIGVGQGISMLLERV